jgi:hypothetical protein
VGNPYSEALYFQKELCVAKNVGAFLFSPDLFVSTDIPIRSPSECALKGNYKTKSPEIVRASHHTNAHSAAKIAK